MPAGARRELVLAAVDIVVDLFPSTFLPASVCAVAALVLVPLAWVRIGRRKAGDRYDVDNSNAWWPPARSESPTRRSMPRTREGPMPFDLPIGHAELGYDPNLERYGELRDLERERFSKRHPATEDV